MICNFSTLSRFRPKVSASRAYIKSPSRSHLLNTSFGKYKPTNGRLPICRFYSTETQQIKKEEQVKFTAAPEPWGPGPDVTEKVTKLAQQVNNLTLGETMEFFRALAKQFKLPEEFFFKDSPPAYAPPGGYAAPPPGAEFGAPQPAAPSSATAAATPKKEEKKEEKKEKSTVSIKLVKVNEGDKYKVLKEVRTIKPGMNLTESKTMVDTLPSVLKEGVPLEEAKKLAEKIKAAGGEVVLE